jgi:hypothetical protein
MQFNATENAAVALKVAENSVLAQRDPVSRAADSGGALFGGGKWSWPAGHHAGD